MQTIRVEHTVFHAWKVLVLPLILACPLVSQSYPPNADPFETPLTTKSPAETIHVHIQEVNLILSVTDHKGKFVDSLQPSDLTILDNGVEQKKLTFFERKTDLPIKVAFLVDISASIAYKFQDEKNAIKSFLKAVVRPSDSVMVFAFNQDIQLRSPATNNFDEIARRIKRLSPEGETALYDAVSEASQWLALGDGAARRVIILISDGQENKSRTSSDAALSNVLRAEASIYSINVTGDLSSEVGQEGARILRHLSDATGGSYLEVRDDAYIDGAFRKIRRDLRSQYALAYKLYDPGIRTFHYLQVLVPRSLRVHCRSGYYVK